MVTNDYLNILIYFCEKAKKKGQLLIFNDVSLLSFVPRIVHEDAILPFININIDKKKKYILKTYYSGEITKKNPCIESISNNKIYFRSCRVFPTFFIDLLVIEQLQYHKKLLEIKKMFIGYHILGLEKLFKEFDIVIQNPDYYLVLEHWKKRFANENLKLEMLKKYKGWLNGK